MNFAEQLRYIMEAEKLTIKDVADACGITEVSIGRYLKGDRAPLYFSIFLKQSTSKFQSMVLVICQNLF